MPKAGFDWCVAWKREKTGAPIRVLSSPKQGFTMGEMSQALQVLTKVIELGQSDLLNTSFDRQTN